MGEFLSKDRVLVVPGTERNSMGEVILRKVIDKGKKTKCPQEPVGNTNASISCLRYLCCFKIASFMALYKYGQYPAYKDSIVQMHF